MKVVFYRRVKNFGFVDISMKGSRVIGLCLLLMCFSSALPARTGSVQIGGGPDRARVVFDLQRLVSPPYLEQKDQTLIVNFPDTVGNPAAFSNVFIIKGFTFDGKKAVILVSQPFTYTGSITSDPAQFILDIEIKQDAPIPCPIEHIETDPRDNGITVSIIVQSGKWPEVRYAKNRQVFLIFDGQAGCSGIEQKLQGVPYITFDGTMRLQSSTAFSFSLTGENIDMEVKTEELYNKIVLDIVTSSGMSRAKVYAIAKNAFDQDDIAAAMHILEPYKETLDEQESILLARSYWKVSFPYHMDTRSMDALKLMNQGVQSMIPGPQREAVMLEYSRMLLQASLYAEAATYIRFLKESLSPETAAEAYLQEIDIMNRKGDFQDAFVQNKRMLNDLGDNAIVPRLKPYYLSVLGDTYLGLSAYPRALKLYREACSLDPGFFRTDPDLYARMAEASYRLDDFAHAREYILSAINLGRKEDMARHLLFLGECLYKLGQKDKAMGVFSEVENIAPQSESGIIAKLKTARIILDKDLADDGQLSDKGFYEIIDIYENLKSSQEYQEGPLGSIIKIRIAQTYAQRRDWDNALTSYYRAWADTKKDDPIHTYTQAEAEKCIVAHLEDLYQQSSYDQISELYTEYQDSFMQDLQNPEALFILGRSFQELGQTDRARRMFLSCIKNPSTREGEAIAALFSIDYAKGNYADALTWNTRYLDSFPRGKGAAMMEECRGQLLYYMNRPAEAIPHLERAGEKGDENALIALSMLADAHGKLGNLAQRTRCYEKILGFPETMKSPVIEKTLYARATQLKEATESARAQELFERLLIQYPQSVYGDWALYHIAEILHAKGNSREAAERLNTVIQRSTDKILHELAVSYLDGMELGKDVSEFKGLQDKFRGK